MKTKKPTLLQIADYIESLDNPVDAEYLRECHLIISETRSALKYLCEKEKIAPGTKTPINTVGNLIAELGAYAAPEKYGLDRISWELERTALGDGYYGNSLYVAKDIPSVTDDEHSMLERYLTGSDDKSDSKLLQDLAIKLNKIYMQDKKQRNDMARELRGEK